MEERTNSSVDRRRRRRPGNAERVDRVTTKRPRQSASGRSVEGTTPRRSRSQKDAELARRRAAAARARKAREKKKKQKRRKAIAILVAILMILVAAGVGAAYALGLFVNPLDKGTEQLKSGDYTAAVTTFEKAVKDKDKKAEGYQGLGMAHWELGDYKACKEAYKKALDAGAKETGVIYNMMSLCDMKTEDYDSAASNIQSALDLDHNSDDLIQELKYNQIVVYEKQLEWEKAKTKMEEYIAAYPDDKVAAREAKFLETR